MRIATYNVHDCIGKDGQCSPERITAVLTELDADVIALQEVTLDHAGERLASLQAVMQMRVLDGTLFDRGKGRYGNILLSRHCVVAQRWYQLTVTAREPRGVLDARLDIGGDMLRVCATHLGLTSRERRHQIGRLAELLDGDQFATVLLGDFNVWCGSRELRPFARLGFQHLKVRSFPNWWVPLFPLDRIFAVSPVAIRRCWRHVSPLSRVASDHYPIVAEVEITSKSASSRRN